MRKKYLEKKIIIIKVFNLKVAATQRNLNSARDLTVELVGMSRQSVNAGVF